MDGYNYGNMGGPMNGFDPTYNVDMLHGIVGWFAFCAALVTFVAVVFMVYLAFRILTKAGYSGWLALLTLVPFGIFIILLILAFDTWPIAHAGSPFSPAGAPNYTDRVAKMTFDGPASSAPASAPVPAPTPAPAPAAEPAPAPMPVDEPVVVEDVVATDSEAPKAE